MDINKLDNYYISIIEQDKPNPTAESGYFRIKTEFSPVLRGPSWYEGGSNKRSYCGNNPQSSYQESSSMPNFITGIAVGLSME